MKEITIGVVFGGSSFEHTESIRATRVFYEAVKPLQSIFKFKYFYLDSKNRWISSEDTRKILKKKLKITDKLTVKMDRLLKLRQVDIIYNTMMGTCGENGNIMGLADLLRIPMIGCGILASAVALDKSLTKKLVSSWGIPVVPGIDLSCHQDIRKILPTIQGDVGFPCLVKPTNLGTSYYVFRADSSDQLVKKWHRTIRQNRMSSKYLVEKFVPNVEVRLFVFEDLDNHLHVNEGYITELRKEALEKGGVIFNHLKIKLSPNLSKSLRRYARQIFRILELKDYARIDFFVSADQTIYFNEVNTQPFISGYNLQLLARDGWPFHKFFKMMVRRNLDF